MEQRGGVEAGNLIEHYEKVRAAVLGRNFGCRSHWGQALLVSRGVAAWMRAVGPLLAPQPLLPPAVPADAASLLPPVCQDLVHLLSEVVLSVAQNN